jgi:NAD(P)-dependent dehydrogenase (short-subunit alcohol dehydrogenase family)
VVSKLHGKTVVITGASSGMGLAAARAFACHGANLALAARHKEPRSGCGIGRDRKRIGAPGRGVGFNRRWRESERGRAGS